MNTAVITIVILDANRYFAQGLKALLHHYFTLLGIKVRFLSASNSNKAILLFYGCNTNRYTQFCRLHHDGIRQHIIVVKDTARNHSHRYPSSPCLSNQVVIDYRIHPTHLWQSIKQALAQPPLLRQACQRCSQTLTQRERQILSALGKGLSPKAIALQMRLNIKTISAHKRNAMTKLGFARNIELYDWLKNGNLHGMYSPE